MPAPSLTYTLTNGSTSDATQVMQNFNDLLNGYTDGTKDLSISALTCAGTATLNGHVNLGNSSADDLTVTASLASTIPVKTDSTYSIGSTSLRLARVWTDAISGTPTNDSASAGDVGELITTSAMSNTTLGTSATDVTGSSLALTAGNWLIFYCVTGSFTTGASAGNGGYIDLAVYTSADVLLSGTESRLFARTSAAVAIISQSMLSGFVTVKLSGSTTYKLRGTRNDDAGTNTAVIDSPGSKFFAVRIR